MLPHSTLADTISCLPSWPAYAFCWAGFLCRGRGQPVHCGRHILRAGRSGSGWTWTDADHLELTGYAGEAIGADGDLVVTLVGQNSVVETHAPDADISMSGMEVWGNLTLCGPGSLTATGSPCGIHVAQALVVDGCTVDARADGAGVLDQTVAGVAAGSLTVRGGGHVVAAGAGSDAGLRFYGVRLLDEGFGTDAASKTLAVDASRLDATGTDAGVACDRGSLVAAHFVTPVAGPLALPAWWMLTGPWHCTWLLSRWRYRSGGGDRYTRRRGAEDGTGEPTGGADPAAGQPGAVPATDPAMKPAATSPKTTVSKTTVTKTTKPKSTMATTSALPKTGDSHWIAASLTLFLLGTVLLSAAYHR